MRAIHHDLTFDLQWIGLACVAWLVSSAALAQADSREQSAFRVRSDFSAGLNSNGGWDGGLNEAVTVDADRPFRVRFEAEPSRGTAMPQQFRLEYRRNGGDWIGVEAHDFPHPEAEVEFDLESLDVGSMPAGWSIARGEAAALAVVADGRRNVLRARAPRRSAFSQSGFRAFGERIQPLLWALPFRDRIGSR